MSVTREQEAVMVQRHADWVYEELTNDDGFYEDLNQLLGLNTETEEGFDFEDPSHNEVAERFATMILNKALEMFKQRYPGPS